MQSISTSEAVQLIVRDTMRWINANKDSRPGWAVLNFSGLFLFHCQHIRRVPMFSRWSDQKFLKAKFLATDFNGSTYFVNKLTAHKAHLVQKTASGSFLVGNNVATGWTIGTATGTVVTIAHTL